MSVSVDHHPMGTRKVQVANSDVNFLSKGISISVANNVCVGTNCEIDLFSLTKSSGSMLLVSKEPE